MIGASILYQSSIPINEKIEIVLPTVGEVIKDEAHYYGLISAMTAMPIDMMVQLEDVGIDFTQIDEYQLFMLMFAGFKDQDTHLVFGDLDLSRFERGINTQNGEIVLYDEENDIAIDKAIYNQIADTLRQIHHLEKNYRKPGNQEAKEYLLKKERKRLNRRKNDPIRSQLEPLIIAMVNTEQYKYDFESTKSLSIYQFNESVRQVVKKTEYDNLMFGIYSGSINAKEINRDELSWIAQK